MLYGYTSIPQTASLPTLLFPVNRVKKPVDQKLLHQLSDLQEDGFQHIYLAICNEPWFHWTTFHAVPQIHHPYEDIVLGIISQPPEG
jgi:hypothetical protein